MNFKKCISLGLILVTSFSCLTGCASDSEMSNLNNISALGSESSINSNGYALSYTDQQELVYAQVSNRTLLDLSTLTACSEAELLQVTQYMDGVDDQLVGNTPPSIINSVIEDLEDNIDEGNIKEEFTDYLLAEFEKTPYYWQRSNMKVRGVDAESRSIVVDVTYKTLGFKKIVKPNSSIIKGSTSYESIEKNRYISFCNILSTCRDRGLSLAQLEGYSGNDSSTLEVKKDLELWIKVYGRPEKVYEEQSNETLTKFIFENGNQKTYNGVIDNSAEDSSGIMVVRYVLVPKYVMGINLGLTCKHLYIMDYKLDKDVTEGLTVFNSEGYATVTDNIYELIYSYFKCIDESDFNGLYKLTTDFSGLDRYYEDMFETSYRKHNNFSIALFDIKGTHITCGVTVSSKQRAKGSNITMPIYTDRYYVEIDLVGDKLKISDMVLLSRTIEGEPAITTEDAGVSGFSKTIDLKREDKQAIEKLICDFSLYQIKGDTVSTGLEDVIDYSISNKDLSTLKQNMTSLSGKNKVVHLQNYMQGTKNYATVKCKEQYQSTDGKIVEAVVTYDMIIKGNKWYIIGYDILSSVSLSISTLQTSGSLCLVSQEKVESYNSQITNEDTKDIEDKTDISKSYDYKEYTPTTRTGNSSNVINVSQMSEEMYLSIDNNYTKALETLTSQTLDDKEGLVSSTISVYQTCLCFVYNATNGNYTPETISIRKDSALEPLQSMINLLGTDTKYKDCVDTLNKVKRIIESL